MQFGLRVRPMPRAQTIFTFESCVCVCVCMWGQIGTFMTAANLVAITLSRVHTHRPIVGSSRFDWIL